MSQAANWSVPLVGPATPTVMANRINDSFNALLSSNSGNTAPAYKVAGTWWLDGSVAGTHAYKLWDGAAWRSLWSITGGVVSFGSLTLGTVNGNVSFGGTPVFTNGITMNVASGNSNQIKSNDDDDSISFAGGSILSHANGAYFRIEGNDYGGAGLGGKVQIVSGRPGGVGSTIELNAGGARLTASPDGVVISEGLSLSNITASAPSDLSKHLALYGTTYGFSITGGTLNYVNASSAARHDFYGGSGGATLMGYFDMDVTGTAGEYGFLAGRLRTSGASNPSATSTAHALQLGPTTGANLRAGAGQVRAANNGSDAPLTITGSTLALVRSDGSAPTANGDPIPGYYAGSNASITDYALGHVLCISVGAGAQPARNGSVGTVRLQTNDYLWGTMGSGTALSGTWRNHGYNGQSAGGTVDYHMPQRTA